MKKLLLATLALSFALVTACSSTPSPLVKPDFVLTPRLKLDVATISVVDRSGMPTADSTPEAKEFKAMVLASIRKWAGTNIVPVGTFGEAIVVIRDASLKAQPLPHDDDWFTREQATKYIGHIELEVNVSGVDSLREQASAQAVRYETLPDAPTVDERLGVYYRIIEGLNQDLDANLGTAMREHLSSFVLPGTAQLAEGTGKQNVMQAYPAGGQPYPAPGIPYQKVKTGDAKAASPLTVTAPRPDQMAVQYDATYIPIPPEEMDSPLKAGAKPDFNGKAMSKSVNAKKMPALAVHGADKGSYASGSQPQTIGALPKDIGSSVVMGRSSDTLNAKYDTTSAAASVGGYGALPVFQPGEAPVSLKAPGSSASQVSLSADDYNHSARNASGAPAPVIIQGNKPQPSSPIASTANQAPVLQAKVISEQKPQQKDDDEEDDEAVSASAATPANVPAALLSVAPSSESGPSNISPASDERSKTVVGAGGRIRTVSVSAAPLSSPPQQIAQQSTVKPQPAPVSEAQTVGHPTEVNSSFNATPSSEIASVSKPAPMSVSTYVPQPAPAPGQILQTAPMAPVAPVSPPSQQIIAIPSSPNPSPAVTMAKQGEPLYATSSPAAGTPDVYSAPAAPLKQHGEALYPNARYTADIQPPAVVPAQPVMVPSAAPVPVQPMQPVSTVGMIAPHLPETSPLLTTQTQSRFSGSGQGSPCPVPAPGAGEAYGTNCAAALSSPSAYPASPYTVE